MTTRRPLGTFACLSAWFMLAGCSDDSSSSGASCGAFTACGGNLEGTTWQVDDICIEGDFLGKLNAQLSSLPAACQGIIQTANVDMSGTINYASGVETANLEASASFTAVYTKACLGALAGSGATATPSLCSTIESGMRSSDANMNVSCAVAGADCSCNASQQMATGTQTDGYTVNGSTLEYTSGGDPMSFCVQGTTLQERGTSSSLGMAMLVTAHRI